MQKTSELNEAQLVATQHVEGPLLVLAGAGSGKTRIVTHRVAYLLSIGVPASEILCLTFTNKAASEMRDRIRALSEQNVLAATFHSLCARLLRESIHHLGYTSQFVIYDQSDSEQLIKACLESLHYPKDKAYVNGMKSAISSAKNALLSPNTYLADDGNAEEKKIKAVYALYQQRLQNFNALDFDDLLFLTVKLLREHSDVLEHYQKRFNFLLVDEYQDTNEAQYEICRLLAGEEKNLFVVGDPDQSIYSWRGANIENILNFERDFPGAKVVSLEQNYRSANHILDAANYLIQHNKGRYEKNLWSDIESDEKIGIQIFDREFDEAHFVVEQVLKYNRYRDIPLDEIVIFYRTNAQSRSFEDLFLKYGVPYVIIGNLSFYQRREIKDMLSYLRLMIHPADQIAFERVINLPKRGIGPSVIEKLKQLAEGQKLSILESARALIASNNNLDGTKLTKKAFEGVVKFVEVLDHLTSLNLSVSELIIEACDETGYLDYLKLDKESYDDRKANLNQLITKAREWEQDEPQPTLAKFLEDLSLKSATDEDRNDQGAVRLMTLHNSKGLEFTLCFIVGMEEGLFPHANSQFDESAVEEERRLCYVGMTRAKRHLFLSASRTRMLWGSTRTMKPSRFLQELPPESLDLPESMTHPELSSEELYEGMMVMHKTFGKGAIQRLYNSSIGVMADVYFFDDETTRSLAEKYAKLTKA